MPENKLQKILEGLIASRFVEELKDCRATELIGSPRPVITTLNAINLLAAQRCHAYLLNQTVFAKCFQRFWTRGRCASET